MKQQVRKDFLHISTLLTLSTLVFGLYLFLATQNHFSYLEPMLDGTAARPYVYRVLVPTIVRFVSRILGFSPYFVAIIVMYLSLLGFIWAILQLSKIYLPSQYSLPLTLFAPIGLIPFLIEQRHVYDLTTLFLFSLALYFLTRNKFAPYIFTFIFATLSKETSLFLLFFFAIQFWKKLGQTFWLLIFTQVLVYITIRLILIAVFRNNPGGIMEFHLYDHFAAYREHPLNAFLLFGAIIFMIIMGTIHTSDKTNFVRNSLLIIGGSILILYFPFGVPFEVRIFLEAYPSIFLMVALVLTSLLAKPSKIGRLDFPA